MIATPAVRLAQAERPSLRNLFSEAELHQLENLPGISRDNNPWMHLSDINRKWYQFHRLKPGATRGDIEALQDYINSLYGGKFNPYRRTSMRLFALEPEVAGNWGPGTVIANQQAIERGEARVPEISELEYEVDVWLGDELLQGDACYLVTEALAADMISASLTGFRFERVTVSTSYVFKQFPDAPLLPRFKRLVPTGSVQLLVSGLVTTWSGHDVCWGERTDTDWQKPKSPQEIVKGPPPYSLVVTERCLHLLQKHSLNHCDVEELNGP